MNGWLTEGYDYEPPHRGQIRKGTIVNRDERGLIVDLGLKSDGLVPQSDLANLAQEVLAELRPGQPITVRVTSVAGTDNEHLLSLSQVQQEQEWDKAEALLNSGEVWEGQVTGFNKGGVLVRFGQIQAFVPISHLVDIASPKVSTTQRQSILQSYIGRTSTFKVINVERDRNRLVLSERLAQDQKRELTMSRLLDELKEGDVRRGVIRRLTNFGVFVDIGGADGLIHTSELAWHLVRHPSEVVKVGDEIDVYVLRLDPERKRISLSLKQLQPDPWDTVYESYQVNQLVSGTVASVKEFGVFVTLKTGIQGLVHVSELAEPAPVQPQEVVKVGQKLVLRILSIDPARQRIGLSLKQVSPEERERWLAEHGA
jgi:small subunit ribosomal protein S1